MNKSIFLIFSLALIVGFALGASTMIIGDKIITGEIDSFFVNVDAVSSNIAGFIGFNQKRLSNVHAPVEDQDAVTKLWLDEQIQLNC